MVSVDVFQVNKSKLKFSDNYNIEIYAISRENIHVRIKFIGKLQNTFNLITLPYDKGFLFDSNNLEVNNQEIFSSNKKFGPIRIATLQDTLIEFEQYLIERSLSTLNEKVKSLVGHNYIINSFSSEDLIEILTDDNISPETRQYIKMVQNE